MRTSVWTESVRDPVSVASSCSPSTCPTWGLHVRMDSRRLEEWFTGGSRGPRIVALRFETAHDSRTPPAIRALR
jgi:hypothetical protein